MTMKKEELDRLLGKYYSGESTDYEEAALRAYFAGNDIPDEYETEKVIFSYYSSAVEVPEPSAGFESSIIKGIDKAAGKSISSRAGRLIRPLLGVAAGLMIMAGSYFFFVHSAEPNDTFTDPELAYAETMKILMDVSVKLNKGASALDPVRKISDVESKSFKVLNKPVKSIDINLKNLDYLHRAIELYRIPSDVNK